MRRYSISLISLVAVYLSVHPKIANAELRLPDDLKQDDYCKGCKATVQALKKFKTQNPKNTDYDEACTSRYFVDDGEKVWKKLKTCNHLFDLYDDGIQKRFGKYNGDSFQTWLCYEKSYACIGVYNDAKVDYKADDGQTDDDIVRELKEKFKDRIKTPHPPSSKDEL